MRRTYSQVKTRRNCFRSVQNTLWLYPEADVKAGLESTSYTYDYTGDSIICPTLSNIIGVYTDIYERTTISQPNGNVGFTVGVGSLLEDMGRELRFCLTDGQVVVVWRLVKLLTPQSPATVIPSPGNSPNETVGYVTTFCSYGGNIGYNVGLDDVMVIRVG
jgi:hypothetical protein